MSKIEPERVVGVSMPKCSACNEPIHGRYRVAGEGRYHYEDYKPVCSKAWAEALNSTLSAIDFDAYKPPDSRSELGVPVSEIRENLVPSQEKVLTKVIEGRKYDTGKLRYTLLPWTAVNEVVKVLEYGAKKYAPGNWQKVLYPKLRYSDAAMRHLVAYGLGERNDPESGLHHLAHAVCCLLFILDVEKAGADPRRPIWEHPGE